MIPVTGFKCDACGFMRERAAAVRQHEKRCCARPENRACKTCKHLSTEIEECGGGYEPVYEYKALYCGHDVPTEMVGLVRHCENWEAKP